MRHLAPYVWPQRRASCCRDLLHHLVGLPSSTESLWMLKSNLLLTCSSGPLVQSATVTQSLDGDTATTGCFVGGVGICIFDARLGGDSTTTAGPLDCSRVLVQEGRCLEDYVRA